MRFTKPKVSYFFIALAVAFMLLGAIAVKLIDTKVQAFNRQTLKKVSQEKYLLLNKEMDAVYRSLAFLNTYAERGHFSSINHTLTQNSDYGFVAGYICKNADGKMASYFKHPIKDSIEVIENLKPSKYLNIANEVFTVWHYTYASGSVDFLVSLTKLNVRFWDEKLGGYAYGEIYDRDGVYIIGPETNKIGRKFDIKSFLGAEKLDTILESSYLNLKVVQKSYGYTGTLADYQILVSVPLIITESDINDISKLVWLMWGLGVIMVLVFLVFVIRQQRQQHLLEVNNLQYSRERATAELSNLKAKLNPHFLFNTLGTLQQLIGKDADLAKKFVGKLAKVYRSLLQVSTKGLSTVAEEKALAEEYLFLQQIRFGESLLPPIWDVTSEYLQRKLPTLSIELLLENAIKHNEMSKDNPLQIHIIAQPEGLIVMNKMCQRKSAAPSQGYGNEILAKTYHFYQVKGYNVYIENSIYHVFLPYLS